MSNLSEYGELLSALFRLALIAEARGLPNRDDAETEIEGKDEFNLIFM